MIQYRTSTQLRTAFYWSQVRRESMKLTPSTLTSKESAAGRPFSLQAEAATCVPGLKGMWSRKVSIVVMIMVAPVLFAA